MGEVLPLGVEAPTVSPLPVHQRVCHLDQT